MLSDVRRAALNDWGCCCWPVAGGGGWGRDTDMDGKETERQISGAGQEKRKGEE